MVCAIFSSEIAFRTFRRASHARFHQQKISIYVQAVLPNCKELALQNMTALKFAKHGAIRSLDSL